MKILAKPGDERLRRLFSKQLLRQVPGPRPCRFSLASEAFHQSHHAAGNGHRPDTEASSASNKEARLALLIKVAGLHRVFVYRAEGTSSGEITTEPEAARYPMNWSVGRRVFTGTAARNAPGDSAHARSGTAAVAVITCDFNAGWRRQRMGSR